MKDKQAIFEQAAEWAEIVDELTEQQQQELQLWLAADPAHQQAYEKCMAILHSQELSYALQSLPNQISKKTADKPRFLFTKKQLLGSCCLALLALCASIFTLKTSPEMVPIVAATPTDEHNQSQQIALPDGSVMTLAGETQLTFNQQQKVRNVILDKGESLFAVEHIADDQPFYVHAGEVRVQVTGTTFSVDKNDYSTQVIVVEGSVVVGANKQQVVLTAGQSVEVINGKIADKIIYPQAIQHHLQANWLDAQQMSLGAVIAKLDRKLTEQISLEDPSLMAMSVNGRFNLNQPKQTLKMLALASNLRLAEYPGHILIRRN
ncbi:Iron-dicitrate sensor, membrane component [Catenovulum agarivorans DS-2]|uniref:Iron-dicitrate sensor, membrane component n=1 Tax=Catenovulum agarivorans DS-2 TaxID=1328313 RepID=W7R255_9ALTE|nr:FecR domain-containing protein [Catenovulum agarivorans]EWH11700.1 Iron-dicitrate sensor, membrane component [Catenovulum agarivorans DS-2]